MTETLRLFLPLDSVAVSLGADEAGERLIAHGNNKSEAIEIVRTGSRGMHWLEPLLEVEVGSVRYGFGPLTPENAGEVLDAIIAGDMKGPHSIGPVDEHPFLAKQTRWIFDRCGKTNPLSLDDFKRHGGYAGLNAALESSGAEICEAILQSGL
ncbi:MAG: hypothetical protein KDA46_14835, partial [Parvularculaceae bacterium]|nr:hypothetical protein [Parvularculaceae bacterium]